jgi:DNA-binding transcriptional MerR regulator/methylmalonyl-CoA mutase cobalamin-binding subunit
MKSKNLYSIKYVCTCTGLKPHLVRAWESRYQAVVPKRTQTNRRLYCRDDIVRLQLLKLAVDQGHQISCIAGLSMAELRDLLGETAVPPAPRSGASMSEIDGQPSVNRYLQSSLRCVVDLDPDNLTKVLSEAAVQLTRKQWIETLVVPMFIKIGQMWSSGKLKIVNEHMASNCTRHMLWDMLRSVQVFSDAPRIVMGTPVGQRHEIGALAAALASTEAGWRPYYLGADLPAEELASAMKQFGATCIALSITHNLHDDRLGPELLMLRRCIGPNARILVGGQHGAQCNQIVKPAKAKVITSWHDAVKTLALISAGGIDDLQ